MVVKNKIIAIGILTLFFVSCKQEENKAKVVYDSQKEKQDISTELKDAGEIEVVDLPIQFKSSDYLLYPMGKVTLNKRYSAKSSASYAATTQTSYTVSNYIEPEITGHFQNVLFQPVDSMIFRPLTDKPVFITNINYLDDITFKIDKKFLLYYVYDLDTNHDKLLDTNDVKSLYLSENSGENFRKISKDFEEVLDWKIISESSVLIFRTITDTNKNGIFEKGDRLNFYKVDFREETPTAEIFYPTAN